MYFILLNGTLTIVMMVNFILYNFITEEQSLLGESEPSTLIDKAVIYTVHSLTKRN